MTTRPGVKTLQKSSIRGVHITQFVDKIPKGCSTPDFERKPVSLTLQEGKNAIFRAVVKGVPAPEVKWKRAKGEINDPAKYLMFYSPATSEHILQINKITAGDSDLYRCFAVNEYGEASCSAGLRIIQVGFKRKANYVTGHPAEELKKSLQDLKKTLKKRAPLPKQKVLDKDAVFQLLLHADKKDYERICIKYGISDFRGMLRALQDLRKDTENEQAKLIHSIKYMEHIKVNKDGSASFTVEMDLKSASSNIYLLKDGEKVRYGTGDEYRKYYLRQIGKRYHFIVNDVHPEDAGLYQVRVEDVPIFSTELDAESIPVRFQKPLRDLHCHEDEDVVFDCVLRSPCFDAVWLHKAHPLEASEKHQISVSPDGLSHQLIIKNAVTADSGLYTLDTGLCSSRAWLLVEHAREAKIQDEEHEKSDHQKGTPDKDRAKRLKRGEYVGDEDHPMDAGMKRGGWHRSDHGGGQGYSPDADGEFKLLGKEGLHKIGDEIMGPGQFAREEDTGLKFGEDKIGLRHVHSQDSMSGRGDTDDGLGGGTKSHSVAGRHDSMLGAADVDMGDAEGAYSWHDKNAKLGDASSGAAFGGMKSLDATDGSSVSGGINLGSAGVGGAHSVYSKDGLPAAVDMNAVSINREGEIGSPYSKGNLLVDAGGHVGQAGMSGLLYGAGGVPAGDGGRPGAGGSFVGEMEVLYGPDGLPVGAGVDAKRGDLYGKHGQSSEPYGKDGLPAGMEAGLGGAGLEGAGSVYGKGAAGGAAGAGQFGPLYGKDGLPAGAVIGGTGAGGVGSPFGKDGLPAGAGAGVDGAAGAGVGAAGLAGAGGLGIPFGKDGLPAGAGVGAAGLAGAGGVGFPYGKDGLPAGGGVDGAGLAGAGGLGIPYGKDGLPAGAGVGAAGLAGAGAAGSPYGTDGLPAGAGVDGAGLAGAGGLGIPYGKDGLPAGAGVGAAGLAGAGAAGSPYGKDGLLAGAGAGAGIGAAGLAGVEAIGSPYGTDGLLAGAGVGAAGLAGAGGVGSPYGKDGLLAGADAGGAGLAGSPFGKDGLPAGAGVGAAALAGAGAAGSPFGKDGLPAGAGAGVGVAGLAGAGEVGSPYGKDGLPAGAGGSIAGVRDAGSSYGKDGLSAAAGSGAAHFPSGGEEVMGSHRGRDAMLGRAQGSLGGAGGAGLSSEGGGVGGSAIRGAGSAHGSAGSRAGESSAGRLGGDGSELYSVHGKEGVVGAVGMAGEYGLDSRAGKSPYGEAGKGTASDLRGSEHKGSSHDRESLSGQGDARAEARDLGQSGSPYDRDSSFGGAEGKFHDKLFSGWKPGISSQSSQGSDQMSALHGGPSVSQRKQGPGLDIKAGDFLKSTESTENRRRHHLDDLKAPRSRVNKQLADVRVLKGEPTELSCAVNRHDLTGTWFKDGLKLTSMEGVTLEKEGLVHKLIISKVEDIHAGKYRFEAGDIKTEASIFVEDPPQVNEILLKNLMSVPTVAKAGEKVVIKIPFEGRLPVRAMWLKDKIELGDDSRIRVDKTDTFTMLSISNAERKDCGDYKVRLKNDSGILDIDLKVEVIDKPQRPAGPLKIVESSANDVTIQWNPPKDDGGKPVQNYIIEKQQVGKSDWVTVGETPRSCTTFTTSKVEQDMSYYFRVRAVNAEGSSDALESDEVVTISKATPGAPDPPEIVGVSADTITISWKAPRKTGSSRISGYIVQKRKMGSMTWVPVNSVPIADKKLKVTDLKKGLQYEFCVAAVNASGMGDISAASQAAFARDSTKPPGKVRDLKMTISDSSSVTLTWNVPEAEEGSGAKGYNVEMRSANSLSWTKCNIFPIETTTYKIKGLQAKESYFLRVRAINDCGPGEATELEAFTEVVRPVVFPRFIIDKTVKNFLLIKAGNAIRVNIPFEAPPDSVLTWLKDGASLPSRAKISTQDGSSQLLIKAAEFTDSGIYTVELTSGTGKRETFSFQVQVTDIPQPPGPIELRENVPNIVTVTWEPSTSEKWESNLYYTVMKRESQKGVWHVVGDLIYTNKFTYTSVIPGRDYYFRVVAKNYLGSSRPSDTAQPWRIRKQKADVQLRPQRYKGVNQNQPPRFLVPLKPHVVIPGTECRMSCAVGGHPPPKITWYKDGRDLSNNPSYFGTNNFGVCSLVIFGASKADEGDYMVEATNDLGRAFSKASLIVKDSCL
ncbi:immunoglobulin-like and fibronectin type III domain-containing protein 1 isoform X21 [Tympanuchus pallidicinctus]|uniref:immunoglobulin-like and fibronectin type III domain-containing protein 1 isoform X20 n=1 Tax=Tympanuchus pallidicinctus TaxID=109042 RepID=UPI002287708D|nr:immunoglobulin-like and fibronectin type III domain-containing protein 1 isoform X20 [Tympanuchus pallidicinctus]XP_052558446.1 immunoglobulin-like and fibronectin type III domain-containing protein 1 isoform X21 [Tympanuchus pallidicinctus]